MNRIPALGCAFEDIAETVIISPFISTSAVAQYFSKIETKFKGIFFLKGFTGVFKKHRITFISTLPSGNLPGDIVLFLQNSPAKQFLFAGSFGALFETSPGSIFYTNHASFSSSFAEILQTKLLTAHVGVRPEPFPGIPKTLREIQIVSISSLAAEENREGILRLKQKGIQGLDMESASFLSALFYTKKIGSAILFASDFPLKEPLSPQISRTGSQLVKNYLSTILDLACIDP